MFNFHYSDIPVVPDGGPYIDPDAFVERLQSAGPIPEIPFEVHNTRPIDPDRAMDAVRAMCG